MSSFGSNMEQNHFASNPHAVQFPALLPVASHFFPRVGPRPYQKQLVNTKLYLAQYRDLLMVFLPLQESTSAEQFHCLASPSLNIMMCYDAMPLDMWDHGISSDDDGTALKQDDDSFHTFCISLFSLSACILLLPSPN